ncbi:cation diffusion facilitator family transporter [Methanobrevibacter sp. OttesenSCG-928-K11]|nr:cation diffusion facilitator family transporter [Methanobrevibacter sp. OttesenSCG-928-K11]MDL2271173.1 cation diffusion facilitator family transporter [Methanobrevibacter sp. OttesenSCG-928-I08]
MAGIVGNSLLSVLNIVIGIFSGSFALVAEGAHSISDVGTTIVAFIGFKIGQKPPDEEHPLGHGRAESIAGLIIVIFLAFVAYEILTTAVDKMIYGIHSVPSNEAMFMAIIGIGVNIFLNKYQMKIGKEINSPAIIADGKQQGMDVLSNIAILASVIISQAGFTFIDPLVGFLIGLFILKAAFEVGRDNLNNIMGKVPDEDIIGEIVSVTKTIEGVCGIHNVRINYFGSYATISLHVEVNPKLSLIESHNLIHYTQNMIVEEIDIIHAVNAHACPYGEEYNHENYVPKKIN